MPRTLKSIDDLFVCVPDCPVCKGTGHVCENHPHLPWDGIDPNGCHCGGAGMPCPEIEKRREAGAR